MVAKNIRPSMTFKTILAPVSGASGSERVLDTSLMLAKHFGAHVEVLHVSSDPRDAVPLVGEGMSGAMVEEIVQLAEKEMSGRARAARELYDDRLAKTQIPVISTRPTPGQATAGAPSVSWRQEVGREDVVVAVRGRIFDLGVVGRPGGVAD
ncbi:MAG: universal stress protein, partial [Alphaproteobacteria bacterium]